MPSGETMESTANQRLFHSSPTRSSEPFSTQQKNGPNKSAMRSTNGATNALIAVKRNETTTEQEIISLLSNNMSPCAETADPKALLPHLMSMRLLLLRPATRRSAQQNELIETLKCSYKAYSSNNQRSGPELADLLAKDWMCLKSSFGAFPSVSSTASNPSLLDQKQASASRPQSLQPIVGPQAGLSRPPPLPRPSQMTHSASLPAVTSLMSTINPIRPTSHTCRGPMGPMPTSPWHALPNFNGSSEMVRRTS
jgi:hypothetical protein